MQKQESNFQSAEDIYDDEPKEDPPKEEKP